MITPGPDGALWFTLNQANAIGRIGLDGAVDLRALPTAGAGPVGITRSVSTALYGSSRSSAGQIGRLNTGRRTSRNSLCRSVRPSLTRSPPTPGEAAGSPSGAPTGSGMSASAVSSSITSYRVPTGTSRAAIGLDALFGQALETGSLARLAPILNHPVGKEKASSRADSAQLPG